MKKLILLSAGVMIALVGHAQLELRPTVGMNFTNVTESPDGTSVDARVGWQGGLSAMIGNQLYFEPGIHYFSKRTSYSTDLPIDNNVSVDFDQTLNGVNIPLMVGYRFFDVSEDPLINPQIFAGPSAQFLTKTEWSEGEFDEQINWKKYTWAAVVGAGLDISIAFIEVGYSFGLSKVAEPYDQVEEFNDFRENTFYVNAGIRLELVD